MPLLEEEPHGPHAHPDDKFSFGLWTVGWEARDQFGDVSRPHVDPIESVQPPRRSRRLGRHLPRRRPRALGSSDAERDRIIGDFRTALDETGVVCEMVTTNTFSHPIFKDGAFTSNDRDGAPLRLRKVIRQRRPRRRARRRDLRRAGAGAKAPSTDVGQGRPRRARPLPRGVRHPRRVRTSSEGYDLRFAIEPKPNEPRVDIFLPTVGHALGFIAGARARRTGRPQPRGRARADGRAQLPPAIAQALWADKLFHIDLNGQRSIKFDQDLVFGHGDLLSAFPGRPAREGRLRRAAALRLQAIAHRGRRTAWGSLPPPT